MMSRTELHIRFSDGSLPDLVVPVEDSDELKKINNRFLRNLVREHDPVLHKKTHDRRLKFIYNGKPLQALNFEDSLRSFNKLVDDSDDDDDDYMDDENVDNNRKITGEQEIGSNSKGKEKLLNDNDVGTAHKKNRVHKIYIHCLIGDTLTKEELQKEDQLDSRQQNVTNTPAPIGFDRLLSAGFSQDEVNELRQQFQSIYGSTLNLRNANDLDDEFVEDTDDEYEEQIVVPPANRSQGPDNDLRQLEERWIESSAYDPTQLTTLESRSFWGLGLAENGDTSNRDLLVGVLIGAIFGVLSLFLLKTEYKILNKRTRMALVAGAIINFSFAIVRQWS